MDFRLAVLIMHCYIQATSTLTLHDLLLMHTHAQFVLQARHAWPPAAEHGHNICSSLALSIVCSCYRGVVSHGIFMTVSMHGAVLL